MISFYKNPPVHTQRFGRYSMFYYLFEVQVQLQGRSERSKSLLVVLSSDDPLHRHQPGVGLARPSGDQPKLSAEMESSLKVSSVTGS